MNIIGMGVVARGEGDRYLEMVLERNVELCDRIVLWGDNVDEKTKSICRQYKNVDLYNNNVSNWATHQPVIKKTLLVKKVAPLEPDWILPFDMDEVLDSRVNRSVLEEMTRRRELAFTFFCAQLWDREDQIRVDGGWGGFWNVRFYRFMKDWKQAFLARPLHCGLAPVYAYGWSTQSEFLFKHYGYLKHEDRLKKIERYRTHDPNAQYLSKDWYWRLEHEDIAEFLPFNEKEFGKRLKYVPRNPNIDMIGQRQKQEEEKIILLRTPHGRTHGFKEKVAEELIKKPGYEIIEEGVEPKVVEPPQAEGEKNEGSDDQTQPAQPEEENNQPRQYSDMKKEELEAKLEELGLTPADYKNNKERIQAIRAHE